VSTRAYAGTGVPVEQTKGHIRKLFRLHGIEGFRFTEDWKANTIGLEFVRAQAVKDPALDKFIEVRIPVRMHIPVMESRRRRDDYTQAAWERRERQVWRALYYYLKSQLEAVEFGLRSLTDAFMADIVTADGRTIGDQVKGALHTGRLALPAEVTT
jgi:hypothetical protein